MNSTSVGDSLLKGVLKSEGEVRLGQSFPSPMAVTRGMMGLPEYLDGFSLPRDRIGWHTRLHLPLGERANMTQS